MADSGSDGTQLPVAPGDGTQPADGAPDATNPTAPNPADVSSTAAAAAWNNEWASSLVGAANSFIVERNWLVGTDRYNGVNGLQELPWLNFDIPNEGIIFENYTDEMKKFEDEAWPTKMQQAVPGFANPQTSAIEFGQIETLLATFERFADVLPALDPADPQLNTVGVFTPDPNTVVDPQGQFITPAVPAALTATAPQKNYQLDGAGQAPNAPNLQTPQAPSVSQVNIPGAPVILLPAPISAIPPQNLLVPPTDRFSFVDAPYTSQLRDPLVSKLLDNLVNGGYGIDTNDEAMLWNRARDRETQKANVRVAEVIRQNASLSFPMPQGSLYAGLVQANQELQASLATLNREVALKRADMYVENRKFTIEQVREYEKLDRDFWTSVQERALNVAKNTVELAIQRFNMEVLNFNTKLEAYKTGVAVYEIQIKAELAKIEMYNAQMRGLGLQVDIQKAQVDLFRSQIAGSESQIALYRGQIEAMVARIQADESKIHSFEAEVKAYAAQVASKSSEYENYTAQWQSNKVRVDLYGAQLEKWKYTNDEKWKQKQYEFQINDEKLKKYRMQIDNFRDRLDAASKKIALHFDWNKQNTTVFDIRMGVFKTLVEAMQENMRTQLATHKLNYEQNIAINKTQVEAVKFSMEKLKAQLDLIDKANSRGMEFYRSLLGATLSNVSSLSVTSSATP